MKLQEIHARLASWYQQGARSLPWRTLWEKHQNPWHIWVSEIMLQQTVIKAVLPVYDRFLKLFPSPASLAEADTESVRLAVRGLGYYRRFDLLHRAVKYLHEELGGKWPADFSGWKNLPGIGDYTASAITSITLGLPHGVVDGNVERVLCRWLDIRTAPNLPALKMRFKKIMDDLVAFGDPGAINQSVMELGQTVCTPTSPACAACPVAMFCAAKANGSQELSPGPKAKIAFKEVSMALIIPRCGQSIGLWRRSSEARFLKGTLGFPTLLRDSKGVWQGDGFAAPPWMIRAAEQTASKKSVKHSITNHKIAARVLPIDVSLDDCPVCLPFDGAESSLVSNLDRKALHSLH